MPWRPSFRYYMRQPGLTNLTEIEVEHLVELAKARREDALWVIPLLWTVVLWACVMGPLILLLQIMRRASASSPLNGGYGWSVSPLLASFIIALAAVGLLVASTVVWVWIRRALIMRSIRLLLSKSACPYCDFDLRGLRVADNAVVRCPECGEVILLKEHGMTRRDLSLDEGFTPLPVSPLWHLPDDRNQTERPAPPETNSQRPAAHRQAAKGRSSASSGN